MVRLDQGVPPLARPLVYLFLGIGFAALIIDWIPKKVFFDLMKDYRLIIQIIGLQAVLISIYYIMKIFRGDK